MPLNILQVPTPRSFWVLVLFIFPAGATVVHSPSSAETKHLGTAGAESLSDSAAAQVVLSNAFVEGEEANLGLKAHALALPEVGSSLFRREQTESLGSGSAVHLHDTEPPPKKFTPKNKDNITEEEAEEMQVGKPHFGALFPVLLGAIACIILIALMAIASYRPSRAAAAEGEEGAALGGGEAPVHDVIREEPGALEEDLYGIGIASLVRDSKMIAQGSDCKMLRISRITATILLISFCITVQVFLLLQLKFLVSAASVTEIRQIYDKYEGLMYQDHVFKTVNGFRRGIPSFFDASKFKELKDEDKEKVCRIPLSQPTFLMILLLIWTFTVTADVRAACEMGYKLCITTPTVDSMINALENREDEEDAVLVAGLTTNLKALLAMLIIVPRILVDLFLLYLGCRWLIATPSFQDLLLNAVALEFILVLQTMVVSVLVSQRNKYEAARTYILPFQKERPLTPGLIMGTFGWGIAAIIFVLLYMYKLQQVLPMYNWDVRTPCMGFLEDLASGKADNAK